MLWLRQARKTGAERRCLRTDPSHGSSEHGVALEVARLDDLSWRSRRRSRALRAHGLFRRAYTAVTDMLARMGLVLAIAFLAGLSCLALAVLGDDVPLGGFGFWMVGVAISGIALLIVLGGACWIAREGFAALFRKWAEHQVIDLEPDVDEED